MSTTTIGRAQIEVAVDAAGVDVGVSKAKRSLAGLADAAAEAGARGARGVGAIGDGGDSAAKKVEQTTRSMIGSIQRATAAMEAGSKSGAAYYAALAAQRGVDPAVLRPYLAQLEAVRARQEALTRSTQATIPTFNTLTGTISGVQNALAGLAAAAGLTWAAGIVKGAIDGMAALHTLSERTGATVEGLSALRGVAKISGVSMDEISSAMQRLSKNMVTFDDDGKAATKAIAAIGLSAEKLRQERPDEAIKDIADALAKYEGGANKVAVAIALFGKAGADVLPFLADLAETGKLQAKVTAEQADQAYQFEKSLAKLSTTGQGWQKEIAAGMLPTLNDFAAALLSVANEAGGLRNATARLSQDGSINAWATDAVNAATHVIDAFAGVVRVVQLAAVAVKAVGQYGAAVDDIHAMGPLASFTSAGREALTKRQGELSKAFEDAGEQMKNLLATPLIGQRIREAFAKTTEAKTKALQDYAAAAKDVAAAYAGQDVKIAQAAQKALKESYFGAEKQRLDFTTTKEKEKEAKTPKEISDYARLTDSISKYVAQLEAETAGQQKLTEAQKLGVEVRRKLSAAHQADLSASLQKARSLEIALELQKLERQAEEEAAKAIQARADKLRSGADAIVADTLKIREHTAEIGLSASAISNLKAARDADTLATLQNELALLDATGQCTAYSEALRDNVAALSERAEALRTESIAQAGADAAKKAEEDWKKTSSTIEQSLTDALMRGFEGGKDLAKNLRDTVVNMFKTMVLRPIVQATVTGGMESLGLGGTQQGQQTVGAQLQNANSLISGVNNIFNVGTMISGGYGALPGTLTASNIVGAFGGDSLGALIATNPQWTAAAASAAEGAVAASAAAEGAAAAAVAAEGAAATFGSAAAAAIPYVGWVVAAAGVLYSIFGGDGPGKSQGAAAYTSLSGGRIGPTDIGEGPADKYASGYQVPLNNINTAFLGALDAIGNALGRPQSINLTSAIKARGDGKQYGGLSYSINGGQQQDFAWAYDEGDQQATAKLAAKALSEVLVEAIKASSFGDQITSLFDGLTSPESTLQMVQAVVALSKASEQLNDTWGLTIDQAATVARLTANGTEQGRVAAAAALAQAAIAKKAISASLVEAYEAISEPFSAVVGRQLPLSLNAYDDALKAVDKSTHAGIEAFSLLFSMRGNFSSFVAAIDSLRTGVNTAIEDFRTPADRIARRQAALDAAVNDAGIALPSSYSALVSLADGIDYTTEAGLHLALTLPAVVSAFKSLQEVAGPIAEERKGLQGQLDELTLTSTQLLERQRAALDASNRALFDQVQAATAAKRVSEERKGLQEQFDALTLTSTQLLERQRDALDASNRALFDQIQAATEAKRVTEERRGLQDQLDALTLTSTQLLDRQRAALDASNQSLFDQIQAATEAKRVADERQRLQDQLDQALGDTAALRQRELAALDPSNRALQSRLYALADEKAAREADAAAAQRARDELQSAYNQRLSDARSRLQSAYQAESSALETLTDRLSGFAQAARSLLDDLYYGASSPLSSQEQFARAQSGLAGVISRVRAADTSALPELQTFLDLSKSNSATFVDYARDFAQVSGTLIESEASADAQAGLAKQQLAQLKKLTDGVLGVDSSVLSVAEAIAALNAVTEGGLLGVVDAVASSANVTAGAIAAALASSSPVSRPSIQTTAGQAAQLAAENATWTADSDAAARAYGDAITAINQAMLSEHYGDRRVDDAYRAEIFRSFGVPGYASGGDFAGGWRIVGESGRELEATGPARIFSASQTSKMLGGEALIAEVRSLREEVVLLRAEARATASNTGKSAKILDRVMPDGDALTVRVAT